MTPVYTDNIWVLIQAIKEQQIMIDQLKTELSELKKEQGQSKKEQQ